jgi:hypothetical protein
MTSKTIAGARDLVRIFAARPEKCVSGTTFMSFFLQKLPWVH